MSNPQRAVTVGDTATLLVSADPTNRPVWIQVVGNSTVYIGNANVTTANGFPLAKHSAPIQGELGPGAALYGICAAGVTAEIRIYTVPED